MRKLLLVTLLCLCIETVSQNRPDGSVIEHIDFSNVGMVGSDSLANAVVGYLASCEGSENVSRCQFVAADDLVMEASANAQMYDCVLRGLMEVLDSMGKSKIVDYLADLPYAPFGEMTDEQISDLKSFAESHRKVRIGSAAPEIEWEAVGGRVFRLSDETGYCVLSFVSLDCEHCREWLADIRLFQKQYPEYKLVVWTVNSSDREMKRFLRRNKLGNMVCLNDGMGWNSPVINEYCVSSTPCVFVIDENMIIVDKPESVGDLFDFANNHKK